MKRLRNALILLGTLSPLALLVSILPPFPGIPSLFLAADTDDELLLTSTSPDGRYTLTAYHILEGATVANSIRVYRAVGPLTVCVYNAYREDEVAIIWRSEDIVEINGVPLDLSAGENYDWRR